MILKKHGPISYQTLSSSFKCSEVLFEQIRLSCWSGFNRHRYIYIYFIVLYSCFDDYRENRNGQFAIFPKDLRNISRFFFDCDDYRKLYAHAQERKKNDGRNRKKRKNQIY